MNKQNFNEKDKENFRKYAERKSPDSKLLRDFFVAFAVGGLICILGELISDFGKMIGISKFGIMYLVNLMLLKD